jgi:ABC-type multidrug transport system ATPase subunit
MANRPSDSGQRVGAARSWLIGRDPNCDLILENPEVSSRHCRLSCERDVFSLEDLGSTNGTFVNGTRINSKVVVKSSDRITLGTHTPFPWPESASDPISSLSPRRIRIGRASDNDVTLDYPMVSGYHAELLVANGKAEIRDLGSSNGTAIGHPGKKIKSAALTTQDTVYFGSLRVPASELFKVALQGKRESEAVFTVTEKSLILGRAPMCDQVLDYPMISGQHARLSRSPMGLSIEDLRSSNGTYVNGRRIDRTTPVRPGDVIGLGSYTFTLLADGAIKKHDIRGHITLEARDVAVEVPQRRLLDPVSLTIYPTEVVALMGPSGAGKTTLLNALNGYSRPTGGQILFNGQDLYKHYVHFRTCMGYVPQDDVMHRDLTVGQALFYTGRLRLPSDYSRSDIQGRIAKVIEQLGLQGTENVLIGSAERKGISGGQRKRVNLAMELLTDPLILFLDEPTSGLSSEDALAVMQLLRKLANEGKTILISIHQPSLEVFRLVDNLVVVGRDAGAATDPGQLVYYGPAYPEAVNFFNPTGISNLTPGAEPSPDEVLRGLKKAPVVHWVAQYSASTFRREYVADRASTPVAGSATPEALESENSAPVSQWITLFNRGVARKLKDRINTIFLLAQAPLIGLLLVGVFGDQLRAGTSKADDFNDWSQIARGASSCIFQLVVVSLWFGCSNAVREIVGEWAIYHRERMVNLKLLPYVAFKFALIGGLCLIQCAMILGIVRFGCNLKGPFWPMYGIMVLMSLTGVGVGLVLSAASRTQEIAITLLPIALIAMVVLGGGMQPVHKLHRTMQLATYAVPSRWAFESLLLLEANAEGSKPWTPPPNHPAGKQDIAEYHFPKEDGPVHRGQVWHGVLALGIILSILVAAVFAILRMRDVH